MSMRRRDREVTERDEMVAILRRCDTVRLGIANGEGAPYIVPLSFGLDERNGRLALCFHCAPVGRKLDLLAENPQVSFEADALLKYQLTKTGITARYESVMGTGTFATVDDPDEAMEALRLICEHCGFPDYPLERCGGLGRVVIAKVNIDSLTAKRNPPLD